MSNNNDALAEFVRSLRKSKKLSQADVRRLGGPSTGWLGDLEAGTMLDRPKPDTLIRLAKALGVEPERILSLAGYMSHQTGVTNIQEPAKHGPGMLSGEHGYFSATDKRTIEGMLFEVGGGDIQVVMLPLYGPVSAGAPLLWSTDDPSAYGEVPVLLTNGQKADGAFIVRGDSVSALGIEDGDQVAVLKLNGNRPEDGVLVIAEVEGAFILKVYRRAGNAEFLESRRKGEKGDVVREVLLFNDDVRLVGEVVNHTKNIKGMRF